MRTYKNYEIQMTGDVPSTPITPSGGCIVPFFQAICKNGNGDISSINLGITLEDVSDMSREDADNLIYEEACKLIDHVLASQNKDEVVAETTVQSFDGEPNKNKRIYEAFNPQKATDENVECASKSEFTEDPSTGDSDEKNIRNENKNEPTLSGEELIDEEQELSDFLGGSDPFSETAQRKVAMMVKQSREAVQITEQIWEQRRKEYKLKDDQMKALYQINEQNKVPIPENISDEERNKWDHFNGIDKITFDEINEIFGSDHPISIAPSISDSIYLIKETMKDFFGYLSALREYKNINNAYLQYIDMGEMKQIHELETIMENENDPEKKELMKKSIDEYYSNKYLNFLAEPLDQKEIDVIVEAYGNDKKIEYWLKRAEDKLRQVKIDPKFILEISKFEKRFLPEEYHHLSNITLVYFLRKITYTDMGNTSNLERTRIVAMVIALDQLIGNRMHNDYRDKVLSNVKALLDQFSDIIKETYGDQIEEEGDKNE